MTVRDYLDYLDREFGSGSAAGAKRASRSDRPGPRRFPCRVRSRLLGEIVWLVGDEGQIKQVPKGEIAYLPSEVEVLRALPPDHARRIHLIKKELDGFIRWHKRRGPSAN